MSFIVKAVKSVVKAVVNVVKAVVKAVVDVVTSVVNFAIQAFMPGMPGVDSASEAARQQGVLLQREGSDINIPVIYGHRKVGGTIAYMETGSTNNRYLWVAYILGEGQVEGLRELWIDDNPLPAGIIGQLNGGATATVAEGRYKGRVTLRFSPGVYYANPASSPLAAEVRGNIFSGAPSFASDMYYNGLAVLFARYEWFEIKTQEQQDANPFGGGVPKLQACVLGRRVATLVNNTSESTTYGGSGYAERYSTNPAEILLDYLRNPRYGKGLSNSEIDWASFRTAAAKLNTAVPYYGGGPTGAIITNNSVIDTAQTLSNNVKILLQGMRGYMPYVQGQYKLRIEDAGNATDILSGSATIAAIATTSPATAQNDIGSAFVDIMGDITYTGIERSAKYTQVAVTFVDPDQGWSNQQAIWPETEAERQTFVTADGGRENATEVTMGTITNRYMALDMARLIFNKSREQESCTVTVSSRGMELEPGDCITITGTILNFGTTVWRIISLTYNDDYTITLGCVRNPESIYPYTRLNEADTIAGVFRPVAADINPPLLLAAGGGLGVSAPTTITYVAPSNFTSNTTLQTILVQTNPTQTNVSVNNTTTSNTAVANVVANTTTGSGTTTTAPNNPAVTAPPPPPPLNTVVDFKTITFQNTNNGVFGTIRFNQPDHALYEGIDFYYVRGSGTVWQYADVKEKPGAGKEISFVVGPLIIPAGYDASVAVHNYRAIVKYTTGERSTQFVTGQFTPSATSGTTVAISEVIQLTASAWTTPNTTQGTTSYDNDISVRGLVSSIGSPGATRTISFLVKDDINQQANWHIDGVAIYWKPSASTYWNKTRQDLAGTFIPGSERQFAFTGDIGIVGGPVLYDFIFRWYYTTGQESSRQLRTQIRVESPFATYPYDPFYGSTSRNEASTAYAFQTTDQAPPEVTGAAANVRVGINFIGGFFNNGANDLTMALEPPAAADLANYYRGISLQYRKVLAGGNPPLTVANIVPQVNGQTGKFNLQPAVRPWEFDTQHEMIIVPIVTLPGGNRGYSNVALRGVGYVHNRTTASDYPADTNWLPTWNFEQTTTQQALRLANQPFPAGSPTVSVRDVVGITGPGWNYYNPTRVALTNPTRTRLNQYMRIRFNKPAIGNYVKTWIYRRVGGFHTTTIGGGYAGIAHAKYWGLGRWERIEVTDALYPPDANGIVTVNLRGPTHNEEFDRYYQVPGYNDATKPTNTYANRALTNYVHNGGGTGYGWKPGRVSYWGFRWLNRDHYPEILVIVETTSGLSDRAIRFVPDFRVSGTDAPAEINLVPTDLPQIFDYSAYNAYDAGYQRNISEARTPVALNNLQVENSIPIWDSTTNTDTNTLVMITATPAVV